MPDDIDKQLTASLADMRKKIATACNEFAATVFMYGFTAMAMRSVEEQGQDAGMLKESLDLIWGELHAASINGTAARSG